MRIVVKNQPGDSKFGKLTFDINLELQNPEENRNIDDLNNKLAELISYCLDNQIGIKVGDFSSSDGLSVTDEDIFN